MKFMPLPVPTSAEDFFGPSVNSIILDFLIDSENDQSREEIETHVKKHISKISESNPEIKKRVPSGRESIIFWTDYLESNGTIKTTSKRPKKYTINYDNEQIKKLFPRKYKFDFSKFSSDKTLKKPLPSLDNAIYFDIDKKGNRDNLLHAFVASQNQIQQTNALLFEWILESVE